MKIRPLVALLAAAFAAPLALNASAAVVISQVYGGGGNSGATLKNDFIELFNNGSTAVNLSGWSVQYAAANFTDKSQWAATALPAISLQPGQYLLIQEASQSATGAALPTPDATGSIAMGAATGRVAVSSSTAQLTGATPTAEDFYLYSSLSATAAAVRSEGGCGSGFTSAVPAPRNSATTLAPCSGAPSPAPAPTPAPAPAAFKQIYEIQGSGATSPLAGQSVTTEGVATRVVNTGFFIQSLAGDNNPATSDGIFVYTATAPTVAVGQLVRVTGNVSEYAIGSSTVTEIVSPTIVSNLPGYGSSIAPTPISLPVAGGLERYEGMLVTLAGPLTVGQNYFQARYGQVTLSAGGRLETPTNKFRPGSAEAVALAAANAARMVVLEDGSSLQNIDPTPFVGPNGALRGGDTIGSITGVIDYGSTTTDTTATGPGAYRILPLDNSALQYSITNPRTATPPAVGGNVKLASFNVLNYFTTFTNGQTADGAGSGAQPCVGECRGANSLAEFTRQQAKIVTAISAIDADALGLMEIQNNAVAAQNLVAALNAKVGAGTYAVAPGSAAGVVGTDAIKTTVIYKPAKLEAVGNSVIDNNAVNNRPTVAQTFKLANGLKFTLVVNHLKSKGSCPASSSDPDADKGDGQGCYNATRVAQATQLRNFVAQLQTSSGSNDVVLVGDFNANGMENPITTLTDNGYVDQIARFNTMGYSYVFDGAVGRLDQAITTASLSPKVNAAVEWHINADESLAHDYNLEFKKPACSTCAADPYQNSPYRSSDHDPVVMGLNLYNSYITAASTSVVGTTGDDLITVGALKPTLTGGAGRDQFAFAANFIGGATITDFTPGTDVINLRAVLRAANVAVAAPLDSGNVICARNGASDVLISLDPDAAGPAPRRPLLLLKNMSCGALNASSFQF